MNAAARETDEIGQSHHLAGVVGNRHIQENIWLEANVQLTDKKGRREKVDKWREEERKRKAEGERHNKFRRKGKKEGK